MGQKQKTSLELASLGVIKQRATEDGMSMSAWLDALVQREDLRRRIHADREALQAAGLYDPARLDAVARAAIASRTTGA